MRDRVWFTFKARIVAHERLDWLDFHSQMLLAWYALLSAGLAIITIKYPYFLGDDTEVVSAFLSIALLVLSLTISSQDFRGRAIHMRHNYLKLQELYFETSSNNNTFTQEQISTYSSLLSKVENHKDIDDCIARVKAKGLTSRKPTNYEKVKARFRICFSILFTSILYSAPVFLYLVFQYD